MSVVVEMRVEVLDDRHGVLRVKVEGVDDLWLLSLMVSRGDIVRAQTLRDVSIGDEKRRIPMVLSVSVEKVEFQHFTNRLRIHGVVVEGPDRFGVQGSHHTLSIGVGSEVLIVKKVWSRDFLDRIMKFVKPVNILAIAIDFDEYSVVHISMHGVRVIEEKNISLPLSGEGFSEEKERVLREIAKRVVDAAHRYSVEGVVIGSPSFMKEDLQSYIRELDPNLRIYLDTVSNGGYAGIQELLHRDTLSRILRDTAIDEARKILEEFEYLLVKDMDRVAYGLRDVEMLAETGAVEKVVIVDELIMFAEDRERIDRVISTIMSKKGVVVIVPSTTPIAERIKMLGGAIAILRYGVPKTYESSN